MIKAYISNTSEFQKLCHFLKIGHFKISKNLLFTAKMAYQPDSKVLAFIETVGTENQWLYIELANSEVKVETLHQKLGEA